MKAFSSLAYDVYTADEIKEALLCVGVNPKDIADVQAEGYMVHPDEGLSYDVTYVTITFTRDIAPYYVVNKWAEIT